MVVQLSDGKVHIISDMEDVRELIDPELFEAILELMNDKEIKNNYNLESEISGSERDIEDLEYEIQGYNDSCFNMKVAISDATEDVQKLIDYILENDDLNKNKIIEKLYNINETLENCND